VVLGGLKRRDAVWWHEDGEPPRPARVGWIEDIDGNRCSVAPGFDEPTIELWTGHVHHADEKPPVAGCLLCDGQVREALTDRPTR
jgi:hypothetical protein